MPAPRRRRSGCARHHQKAGGVVGLVLDLAGQHVQPVDLARQFARPARPRPGRPARPPRARRAALSAPVTAPQIVRLQEAAALARQDHHVAMRRGDRPRAACPARASRLTCTRTKASSMMCRPELGQQRMHVGHPAIGRILDRQHPQIDLARADRVRSHPRRCGRERPPFRAGLAAGLMRIGAQVRPERRCGRLRLHGHGRLRSGPGNLTRPAHRRRIRSRATTP